MTKNLQVDREKAIAEFQKLPGVGKRIASDFWRLGIRSISDLKKWKAEDLYNYNTQLKGKTENRALLYIMRCAIYIAKTPKEKRIPEKMIWWNWKDKR
ncbi:MAG: helix-hairpin-helix domain-containing protein [Bacteroidota bacterium]